MTLIYVWHAFPDLFELFAFVYIYIFYMCKCLLSMCIDMFVRVRIQQSIWKVAILLLLSLFMCFNFWASVRGWRQAITVAILSKSQCFLSSSTAVVHLLEMTIATLYHFFFAKLQLHWALAPTFDCQSIHLKHMYNLHVYCGNYCNQCSFLGRHYHNAGGSSPSAM